MTDLAKRAAEALELLPEEMQEAAVAYLYEQGEKFRILKTFVQEGIDDVEAGCVSPLDIGKIRALAREIAEKQSHSAP